MSSSNLRRLALLLVAILAFTPVAFGQVAPGVLGTDPVNVQTPNPICPSGPCSPFNEVRPIVLKQEAQVALDPGAPRDILPASFLVKAGLLTASALNSLLNAGGATLQTASGGLSPVYTSTTLGNLVPNANLAGPYVNNLTASTGISISNIPVAAAGGTVNQGIAYIAPTTAATIPAVTWNNSGGTGELWAVELFAFNASGGTPSVGAIIGTNHFYDNATGVTGISVTPTVSGNAIFTLACQTGSNVAFANLMFNGSALNVADSKLGINPGSSGKYQDFAISTVTAVTANTSYAWAWTASSVQQSCSALAIQVSNVGSLQTTNTNSGQGGLPTSPSQPSGTTNAIFLALVVDNVSGEQPHSLNGATSWTFLGQNGQVEGGVAPQIDQQGWVNGAAHSSWQEAGSVALVAGAASVTLPQAYGTAAIAVCTDTTSAAAVKCSSTATTLTIAGTGTDTINWLTVGY